MIVLDNADTPVYFGADDSRNVAVTPKEYPSYQHVICNISSLCATVPFHCMDLYCTGKAARHMHMKAVALEQSHSSKLASWSYSPGPMDTDMQTDLRTNSSNYAPSRAYFTEMKEKGTLVQPCASARVVVNLILQNQFGSGQHLDYYDVGSLSHVNDDTGDSTTAATQ